MNKFTKLAIKNFIKGDQPANEYYILEGIKLIMEALVEEEEE